MRSFSSYLHDDAQHRPTTALRPRVRLFAERVIVTRTEGLRQTCDEELVPLLALSFDGDEPDAADEQRARAQLERLGAVEVDCLDEIALPPGCDAQFVVRAFGETQDYCSFGAKALPVLRAAGWEVEVAEDYPFRVIAAESAPWFADVEPDEKPDWFSLELGVEVEGARIDLLPLVLELLEGTDESEGLTSIVRRFRSTYALPAGEGRHVTVSQERLRALLRVVVELYRGSSKHAVGPKLVFPAARAPALARLEKAFAKEGATIAWHDPKGIAARARAFADRPRDVSTPATLQATLRDYQREGVAFLQHLRASGVGGVLADDMGLGKTLQTIAHLCIEKASGRLTSPAIVVAPTSLVGNWAREIARFAPHLKTCILHGPARRARFVEIAGSDVVITTYPVLVRDQEMLAEQPFHVAILDEAQAIKNIRTQAHRAMKQIQAASRLCLTGTPVENHLGELWAIFDFLNPGVLGDEVGFRRWYRQPIEQQADEERLAALREQVAPYILRRVKKDVARELPPKTELLHPVEIAGKQRELYEAIRVAAHAEVRKMIRAKGLAASAIPILDALMKLRQVCCDPRLVKMDAAREVKESAKDAAFFELLEQQLAEGHRVLVFSQFTSVLSLLAEGLRARGIAYLELTGSTRDRQKVVNAFNDGGQGDVFLISLKAGGTGLNLTTADVVVHYDPWWNPAAQAQASDRAYRIGQNRPVFVYNLYVAGSVEERVLRLQQKKKWLSAGLLGDRVEGPALSEREIDELLAPLDD